MSYILIIGAKSDVSKEIADIYARNGYDLYLSGRNINEINDFANDIVIRTGVSVELKELDLLSFNTHEFFFNSLIEKPIGVIVVAGYMVKQEECQNNWNKTLETININYTGIVSFLNIIANYMEKEKKGFIIGVSSVAGDRGRKANYIYGSAKAAFSSYLSGLRNRLYESNVHVLTVKPGFINTKMTKDLDLPKKLTIEPKNIATDIFNAQQKGKDILYSKSVWKIIMLIIKSIPEFIFKKMSI